MGERRRREPERAGHTGFESLNLRAFADGTVQGSSNRLLLVGSVGFLLRCCRNATFDDTDVMKLDAPSQSPWLQWKLLSSGL